MSLYFDISPKGTKQRHIMELKKKLDEENGHLTTGFVGTPILCPALTENGLAEYAYTLLLNEDFPSWLYEVNMGATTIWERWNSVLPDGSISDTSMNSLNHYAYGSVAEWIYGYVCGIQPCETKPGFRQFTIRPYPDPQKRITYAKASYMSVYGKIESGWNINEKQVVCHITVPYDTTCEFTVTDALIRTLTEEEDAFCSLQINKKAAKDVKKDDKITLIPGKYELNFFNKKLCDFSK